MRRPSHRPQGPFNKRAIPQRLHITRIFSVAHTIETHNAHTIDNIYNQQSLLF